MLWVRQLYPIDPRQLYRICCLHLQALAHTNQPTTTTTMTTTSSSRPRNKFLMQLLGTSGCMQIQIEFFESLRMVCRSRSLPPCCTVHGPGHAIVASPLPTLDNQTTPGTARASLWSMSGQNSRFDAQRCARVHHSIPQSGLSA